MRTRVNTKSNHNYTTTTFTTRISSAREMLRITELLRTEQETRGVWDSFTGPIADLMYELKFDINYSVEYFTGHGDVIFELKVVLQEMPGCTEEAYSEKILGTVLLETAKHFGWTSWDLKIDDTFDSDKLKDMLVFK